MCLLLPGPGTGRLGSCLHRHLNLLFITPQPDPQAQHHLAG